MDRIAIIPARGGSKRLPRKNVMAFNGRPMLHYSISAALGSGLFRDVIVSTEDPDIAESARTAGAEVLSRDPNLSTDTATVNQVLIHCLDILGSQGRTYEQVCCLFATAPLRTADDIRKAHALLNPPKVNTVIAVSTYPLPPFQALITDESGYLKLKWPEEGQMQSQKLPRLLVDNGSTYWATMAAYRQEKTFYGDKMVGYEMPFLRSVDIDTEEDFRLAQAIAASMHGQVIS
ncbi:MAG: pseudaminic acid cytidylyltransferase [Ferrovibrio sp.]